MYLNKRKTFAFISLLLILVNLQGQKVFFIHHSTGGNLYTEGKVKEWIQNYNSNNGTNYQISERNYPNDPYPWANYPYDYWNLWINKKCSNSNDNIACMDKLTSNYDVIIFKHCYPGSNIVADVNNPSISSDVKALNIYKLQYRALRDLMDSYPSTKFIVWTLAPLHRLGTTTANAVRAREFVNWVKNEWLTEDGKRHPNIFIFDFFGYAAELNPSPEKGAVNTLKYEYEKSHDSGDSHPNKLANETIGPIFAEFIVNTLKKDIITSVPYNESFVNLFPNPASDELIIDLTALNSDEAILEIYNINGKKVKYQQVKKEALCRMQVKDLSPDLYFLKISSGSSSITQKLLIRD